jgi:hypothetical protein
MAMKPKKPLKVEFYTKSGEKLVFSAEKVNKPIKIDFYMNNPRRKKMMKLFRIK